MARLVEAAIGAEGRAIIEAGTGTGKTLAYLLPAVLSGKRVLVSTATKNLQEQIFYKDVPLLERLGLDVKAVYLKGRSNYLCLYRYEQFVQNPTTINIGETRHLRRLLAWAEETETGDRAELDDVPDDFSVWREVSTGAESCLGSSCRRYDECFVTVARRKAAEAHLLIVNHHLFFADIAVRAGKHGEVLPNVGVVVLDEAHQLESIASSFFGVAMSHFRYLDLASDIERGMRELTPTPKRVFELVTEADARLDAFFAALAKLIPGDGRVALPAEAAEHADVAARWAEAGESLSSLAVALSSASGAGEVGTNLANRALELKRTTQFILARADSGWVYFAEKRGRRAALHLQACPIDVADTFVNLVYPHHQTTVFTSATLTVNGSFEYFRSRIALRPTEKVAELVLAPAFDYMRQALLFVPEHLPEPSARDFVEGIAPVVRELLDITEGRAFVLFTSYRNMRACRTLLEAELPYRILMQGERSRSALLAEFRAEPSVLFATSSFWEGVDVQGDHLSLVIIDKLPFASPGDPVTQARIDYIREQGGDPFNRFQVPEAAVALKQGFGRLIRAKTDRGIVAILDRRLVERGYGKVLINTLPRTRRTRDIEIVRRWWLEGQSAGAE
jgi:ATP-dependent DNA helicase DinG